jgi:hypothetical protein
LCCQVGAFEQIDQVERCGLFDCGQLAEHHQLVAWDNCCCREDGESLIPMQHNWVVGGHAHSASHTGVDRHHRAFVWPAGDSFHIGEDGLAGFQVEGQHALLSGLHKLHDVSLKWCAVFGEQGIEAFRRDVGAVERKHGLIGLEATPAIAQAGIQESPPDALVVAHACRDLLDVRTEALADLRDFVDERNLGGEEGI